VLKINDLHTHYGHIWALKGISLSILPGEIVTLIGANGAGKTTTLMSISGAVRASKGEIEYFGKKIQNLKPHVIAKLGIIQVPEGRNLFNTMTVMENLEVGSFALKDKVNIAEKLEEVFLLFPILKERYKQIAGTLSGGQQQMLAIGRALMANPKLLLLDEPSLGLAPLVIEEVFDIIRKLNEAGNTILLVEQNAWKALQVSNRGYVIENGKIALEGASNELLNNELVRKIYLGGR
jgi:branched-chain amino acid transport system ATP-binding protein